MLDTDDELAALQALASELAAEAWPRLRGNDEGRAAVGPLAARAAAQQVYAGALRDPSILAQLDDIVTREDAQLWTWRGAGARRRGPAPVSRVRAIAPLLMRAAVVRT